MSVSAGEPDTHPLPHPHHYRSLEGLHLFFSSATPPCKSFLSEQTDIIFIIILALIKSHYCSLMPLASFSHGENETKRQNVKRDHQPHYWEKKREHGEWRLKERKETFFSLLSLPPSLCERDKRRLLQLPWRREAKSESQLAMRPHLITPQSWIGCGRKFWGRGGGGFY